MNNSVLGWSALLLAAGGLLWFLPVPGPWAAPVLVFSSWLMAVFGGRRRKPAEAPAPVPAAPPLPPPLAAAPLIEVREVVPPVLLDDIQRFRGTLELADALKTMVAADTEESVIRLTRALFTLVENSKNVSSSIERSLAFINDGDSGLGKTVANLDQQVRVFQALTAHFDHVKTGLTTDIEALTKAVGSINQFSGTLSDLADQTNVLAINASIEAARVGVHGRGFAVIASHVQALAKSSKAISDKMAQTVREVVGSVGVSFARQTGRIEESEKLIRGAEGELRRWSEHAGPQVAEVQSMIGESRKLAQVVTQELGDVTVSLQFQDRTRQMLDHLTLILDDDGRRLSMAAGLPEGPVPQAAKDAAFEAASRYFTVREEWSLGPVRTGAGSKPVELF